MNPKQSNGLEKEEADGHLIVLDGNNGQVHKLNPTAAVIFDLVDGELSPQEIAAQLAEILDIEVANVEQDVADTLVEFASKGLIHYGE